MDKENKMNSIDSINKRLSVAKKKYLNMQKKKVSTQHLITMEFQDLQ